ncbi:hypothetical protein JQN58_17870 [Aneurinibacillus sp. BA2021]|nr:hypothetical protein [Aneurinibacillus sp. BA2021]
MDEQSAMKKAREDGKLEVARKLMEEGIEDEFICRVTDLPLQKVQELRKQ